MHYSIEENKRLIEEYPFLLPRNRFTDQVSSDYDYSYTELDQLPIGWRKLFGEAICKDIKKALLEQGEDALYEYRILQIKEKYGSLRWYDSNTSEKIQEIIYKYEHISKYTCINCGRFQVPMLDDGWISPWCFDCYSEYRQRRASYVNKILSTEQLQLEYNEDICEKHDNFDPIIRLLVYSRDAKVTKEYDCSDVLVKLNL